jgi:putative DNA primase/helicase
MARLEAVAGHRREDMLTRFVPPDYDPAAQCPNWLAVLEEFLPDPAVRDFVKIFSGLGLLRRTVQRVVFH